MTFPNAWLSDILAADNEAKEAKEAEVEAAALADNGLAVASAHATTQVSSDDMSDFLSSSQSSGSSVALSFLSLQTN